MHLQCAACARTFASDNTPMAARAICMMCRAGVTMTCVHCQQESPGFPDGQLYCVHCRRAEYHKRWLYADSTGGRLWRLTTANFKPDW